MRLAPNQVIETWELAYMDCWSLMLNNSHERILEVIVPDSWGYLMRSLCGDPGMKLVKVHRFPNYTPLHCPHSYHT